MVFLSESFVQIKRFGMFLLAEFEKEDGFVCSKTLL
jgi:hypothetical protein